MREDRNVLDLLTADYTFVNERLARHYGIPNVYGSQFRRVDAPDENRRGLLGQGSVLAVTSYPEPHVARAARQVDSGEHPRHAAAAAAAERADAQGKRRGRQADVGRARGSKQHRNEPGVRDLPPRHGPARLLARELRRDRRMARRRRPAGVVDAVGQLADGTPVDGPMALRKAILKHPEQFVRHDDREAADLRARPRARVLRHAGRARDRARRRARRTTASRRSCSGSSRARRSR